MHWIDTGEARSIREVLQVYTHPQVYMDIIDDEVEKKKKVTSRVVQHSCSPWASNVVVVTEHDKTPTITLDYQAHNNVTYKD